MSNVKEKIELLQAIRRTLYEAAGTLAEASQNKHYALTAAGQIGDAIRSLQMMDAK